MWDKLSGPSISVLISFGEAKIRKQDHSQNGAPVGSWRDPLPIDSLSAVLGSDVALQMTAGSVYIRASLLHSFHAGTHRQGVGQYSRLSGFRSSVECRAFSGKRVRGRRERFRSSNLVVEQTAPTEPFGVNGVDLKVGAAAHHGCSRALCNSPVASDVVISGRLLSSSPASA